MTQTMTILVHFAKVCLRILTGRYTYSKWELLGCYLRLMGTSVAYHKIRSHKKSGQDVSCTTRIFDYTVHFTSYPQLINLFEEIFIFQVYHFTSDRMQPLIVDCGSHLGISILYFKKLYPHSEILGFEPHPETFQFLKKNIEINGLPGVSIYNIALSNFEGKSPFFIKQPRNTLVSGIVGSPGATVVAKVDTRRLSNFIPRATDLLKIDVEGSETEILIDLIQSGKIKLVRKMIGEYHPNAARLSLEEMIAKLEATNFTCEHNRDNIHPGANESMIYCFQNPDIRFGTSLPA